MRMPSAITNMFEDIRDAALKGSVVGSMLVSFKTTSGITGTFQFPESDKSARSEGDILAAVAKRCGDSKNVVADLESLLIEALEPFDYRLKYVNTFPPSK